MKKGETLIDTAMTLNAMHPDILVVRHHASGAVELLAQKVDCSVINAGDGAHEHPTQALLDALTIRRNKGGYRRPRSSPSAAMSCIRALPAPTSCCSTHWCARYACIGTVDAAAAGVERLGVEIFTDMREGPRRLPTSS